MPAIIIMMGIQEVEKALSALRIFLNTPELI